MGLYFGCWYALVQLYHASKEQKYADNEFHVGFVSSVDQATTLNCEWCRCFWFFYSPISIVWIDVNHDAYNKILQSKKSPKYFSGISVYTVLLIRPIFNNYP